MLAACSCLPEPLLSYYIPEVFFFFPQGLPSWDFLRHYKILFKPLWGKQLRVRLGRWRDKAGRSLAKNPFIPSPFWFGWAAESASPEGSQVRGVGSAPKARLPLWVGEWLGIALDASGTSGVEDPPLASRPLYRQRPPHRQTPGQVAC